MYTLSALKIYYYYYNKLIAFQKERASFIICNPNRSEIKRRMNTITCVALYVYKNDQHISIDRPTLLSRGSTGIIFKKP